EQMKRRTLVRVNEPMEGGFDLYDFAPVGYLTLDLREVAYRYADLYDFAPVGYLTQIQREVAYRGEVVKVGVAVAGGFDLPLRPAQLVVLHLQFDLSDLQLMNQLGGVSGRGLRKIILFFQKCCLGLPAQPGKGFGWGFGLFHKAGSRVTAQLGSGYALPVTSSIAKSTIETASFS